MGSSTQGHFVHGGTSRPELHTHHEMNWEGCGVPDIVVSVFWVALTVALVAYLAIVAVNIVFGLWAILDPHLLPPVRTADLVLRSFNARTKIGTGTAILALPAGSLSWPILRRTASSFASRRSDLQFSAPLALKPNDGRIAVYLFACVLVVTVVHYADLSWQPVLTTSTWLVLVAVICKEVSYLVSPLPDRLRQASRPPWFSFVVIAAADALTLTFAVANLRASSTDSPVATEGVLSSFGDLFNVPGNIGELLGLSSTELLVAVVGFLYSTALVKTILSPSHFNRTDEDYRRLAWASVIAGNTEDAERWLSKEKQKTTYTHQIRSQMALASGQIDRAAAAAGRILIAKEEPDTVDGRVSLMSDLALATPMTEDQLSKLARYVVTHASDATASASLSGIAVDCPEALTGITDLVTEVHRPLTYSRILADKGEIESAAEVLERSRPESDIAKALRLLRLCVLSIMNPSITISDSEADIREWWQSSFPVVKELTTRLEAVDRRLAMAGCVELEIWLEVVDDTQDSVPEEREFATLRQELHLLANELTESREFAERLRSLLRRVLNPA